MRLAVPSRRCHCAIAAATEFPRFGFVAGKSPEVSVHSFKSFIFALSEWPELLPVKFLISPFLSFLLLTVIKLLQKSQTGYLLFNIIFFKEGRRWWWCHITFSVTS